MNREKVRSWPVLILACIEAGLVALFPVLTEIANSQPDSTVHLILPLVVKHLQENLTIYVLAVPSLIFVLELLREHIRERHENKRRREIIRLTLFDVIPELKSRAMTQASESEVAHRLTLFVPNKSRSKLQIFARSCESTANSKIEFDISEHEESECDGVAGWTFFHGIELKVEGLPDLQGGNEREKAVAIEDYARATITRPETVSEHLWRARGYYAHPVKYGTKKLGVIVLDSYSDSKFPERTTRGVALMARAIARILGE